MTATFKTEESPEFSWRIRRQPAWLRNVCCTSCCYHAGDRPPGAWATAPEHKIHIISVLIKHSACARHGNIFISDVPHSVSQSVSLHITTLVGLNSQRKARHTVYWKKTYIPGSHSRVWKVKEFISTQQYPATGGSSPRCSPSCRPGHEKIPCQGSSSHNLTRCIREFVEEGQKTYSKDTKKGFKRRRRRAPSVLRLEKKPESVGCTLFFLLSSQQTRIIFLHELSLHLHNDLVACT